MVNTSQSIIRSLVLCGLSIAVATCLVIAVNLPWYRAESTYSDSTYTISWSFFDVIYETTQIHADNTTTTHVEKLDWDQYNSPHLHSVYVAVELFTFFALGTIGIVFLGVILTKFCNLREKKVRKIVNLLVFFMSILTPILILLAWGVFFRHPFAYSDDESTTGSTCGLGPCHSFHGQDNIDGARVNWGPAEGWWFGGLGAFVPSIVCFIVFILKGKKNKYTKI